MDFGPLGSVRKHNTVYDGDRGQHIRPTYEFWDYWAAETRKHKIIYDGARGLLGAARK